ncbi:IS1595 family transposase [Aureimonas sp. AU40]|uniref:IS1595 family transposase n=1 Tax=Aureimonas sp. AU40 TaxID=1637747 RepID=UPI0007806FB5|nr:IS1595 family transposase [Aureimonas sp. AU40]
MTDLLNPIFTDADAARVHLEGIRWPNGAICPHCGNCDQTTITGLAGKAHRVGLYQCKACRGQFTVTVGTVFERSKIALNKWLLATHLLTSSKKGMSAHQIHRMLGVTYKTAWFMCHRIREAMREDVASSGPLGGAGKTVEADETYFGKCETPAQLSRGRVATPTKSGKSGGAHKRTIIGLVERGGMVRMFHVNHATKISVRDIVVHNVSRESIFYTDESRLYTDLGTEFKGGHATTKHSAGEYVRYEAGVAIHSSTIENVFGIFKRGMKGVYHHCGEAHLHRYLAEFGFRYNARSKLGVSDVQRRDLALAGTEGKRLTYRGINEAGQT